MAIVVPQKTERKFTPPAQEIDTLNRFSNLILRMRSNCEFAEDEQKGITRILRLLSQCAAQIARGIRNDEDI